MLARSLIFLAMSFVSFVSMVEIFGQPLPPVPQGTIPARLEIFAVDLPVAGPGVGPTDLVPLPDGEGKLVVATLGGTAFVYDPDGTQHPTPFLDLASPSSPTWNADFSIGNEHGLSTIAFHPDFANPGSPGYAKFYTIEPEINGAGTPDFLRSGFGNHHQEALYEYTLSSHADLSCDASCATTKRELFRAEQGFHHNLGDIAFDTSGFMYIGSGDGETSGTKPPFASDNARLLTNIYGKILRIDPLGSNSGNGKYGIPSSNPFVDMDPSTLDEIYAYGLRNPYRIAFDSLTGELYASDTGELSIESVDRISLGADYGWNLKEGSFVYDKFTKMVSPDVDANGNGIGDVAEANGLTDPLFEYNHSAVVGGTVYRGQLNPALEGMYVFADVRRKFYYGNPATGEMFRFDIDDSGASLPFRIHSVNADADGEVYLLGTTSSGTGIIARLVRPISGDFNGDGTYDCDDVNSLVGEIAAGTNDLSFDLTSDGIVDLADLDVWRAEAGEENLGAGLVFLEGDANLDGFVDGQDFIIWNGSKFTNIAEWCSGDFNADGFVDGQDFIIWNSNKFTSSDVVSVPEPTYPLLVLTGLIALSFRRWTAASC